MIMRSFYLELWNIFQRSQKIFYISNKLKVGNIKKNLGPQIFGIHVLRFQAFPEPLHRFPAAGLCVDLPAFDRFEASAKAQSGCVSC